MLKQSSQDIVTEISTIEQTITNIKTTIDDPKLLKVKKDTLKLLNEYPLTYKEFEEYIYYLSKIKDESLLMISNET